MPRPFVVLGGGFEATVGLIEVLKGVHFGKKSPIFGRPRKGKRRREQGRRGKGKARGGPRVDLEGVGAVGGEVQEFGQVGDGRPLRSGPRFRESPPLKALFDHILLSMRPHTPPQLDTLRG